MDIVSLAMNLSQASLATEVTTSIYKMAMDDSVQATTKMTDTISEIVDPNIGNVIDAKV